MVPGFEKITTFVLMKTNSNINEILAFLTALGANNDRTWFKARKDEFDALRKPWEADFQRLIDTVAQWDDSFPGLTSRDAVFRIYRDTRFSNDKTPYKTYFSGVVGPRGRHAIKACSYLHIEPGNCMLGGGIWWPERPVLQQLRSLIDAEADEFLKIVDNPQVKANFAWDCQTLKKMPPEYSKDNPMAQYLKMKEYILMKRVDASYFDCDDWVSRVAQDFKLLQPFYDFLNYVFDD